MLLAKVSPKFRNMKKMKDLEYYRDIFIPQLEKKPVKAVTDPKLALTLSCRRKVALSELTGQTTDLSQNHQPLKKAIPRVET